MLMILNFFLSKAIISQVTDISGNKYKTVVIGNQNWMAENLNVEHYRNGDPIPEAKTAKDWEIYGLYEKGCWCYFFNDPEYGKKYGKLYNWYAVNDLRGLAPEGWHVPSDSEWTQLTNFLGGEKIAANKLKAVLFYGKPYKEVTNESGFSALPGGFRFHFGDFLLPDVSCEFWTSSNRSETAWYRSIQQTVFRSSEVRGRGMSVRCINDNLEIQSLENENLKKSDKIKNEFPFTVFDTDGNKYNTISVWGQEWMTKNLFVEHYRNGDIIPQVQDSKEWANLTTGAWCYYMNKKENGIEYGKLYNWYAVNDPRELAPEGWHIPSDQEWSDLFNNLGGHFIAGEKMKSKNGWYDKGGTNSSGFTAVPGGYRDESGNCKSYYTCGFFWSSSYTTFTQASIYLLYFGSKDVYKDTYNMNCGLSIRCIKDSK